MHPEGLRPDAPDLCLVCGLRYSNDYPWGESGDDASYSYCDCCGTEFGAYDNRSGGIRSLRQEWIKGGMQWRDPGKRPQRWGNDRLASSTANDTSAVADLPPGGSLGGKSALVVSIVGPGRATASARAPRDRAPTPGSGAPNRCGRCARCGLHPA